MQRSQDAQFVLKGANRINQRAGKSNFGEVNVPELSFLFSLTLCGAAVTLEV